MKHLSLTVGALALLFGACSGNGGGGTAQLGARDGSASGGGASGGAPGTQCKSSAECPQRGCFMCPATVCVNGYCTADGTGAGGTIGSGGTSGTLRWYATCGPPSCQVPSGSGGTSAGIPGCQPLEVVGAMCASTGTECDPGTPCSGTLLCTTSDPTHGGQCPESRAKYKTGIEYLNTEERAELARDVQAIPLVRYRYKDAPEREHLGFIIEDVEPSPGIDSRHDRVDLYGYTSMAVAALQEQHRELEILKREIKELRAELAGAPVRQTERQGR